MTVEVGTELPALSVRLTRADLVRYAGASLDFNPIHWNEKTAKDVGLPDVIAHGMLTMAVASRIVAEWIGDLGAIVQRVRPPVAAQIERHGSAMRAAMLQRRGPMSCPAGEGMDEQHGGRAVSSVVHGQRAGPGHDADGHRAAAFRSRAQSGRWRRIRGYTGQRGRWAPGRTPMLIRNSPTISPPVNRKVWRNSVTHSALVRGWLASIHRANEPCGQREPVRSREALDVDHARAMEPR